MNDFVLVQYSTKKTRHYFVDKVKVIHDGNAFKARLLIKRLTKVKSDLFVFPEDNDINEVNSDEAVMKLSEPMTTGGTKQTGKQFSFSLDLETFFLACSNGRAKKSDTVSQAIKKNIATPN